MDDKICSFSGHRQILKIHSTALCELLSDTIDTLITSGVHTFRSGGALGFDLLAAGCVLAKKRNNPDIQLHMILPCRDQSARWAEKFKRAYNNVLSAADEITYVSENYDKLCMQRRNQALVDGADILLCYLTRSFGGTMNTANYAYDKNLKIINLANLL